MIGIFLLSPQYEAGINSTEINGITLVWNWHEIRIMSQIPICKRDWTFLIARGNTS